MKIGTVRPEEAKVFDSQAGFHRFAKPETGEEYGGFEVFWHDRAPEHDDLDDMPSGWYWRAGFPGCLPDGEPSGPFSSSIRAYWDAMGG